MDEQKQTQVMRMLSLWAERLPVAAFARLLPGDTVVGEGRGGGG